MDDEMDGLLSLPARIFLEVLQDLRRSQPALNSDQQVRRLQGCDINSRLDNGISKFPLPAPSENA